LPARSLNHGGVRPARSRNLVIGGTHRCTPALSPENRLVRGPSGFAMRFTGNFYSEWSHARGRRSSRPILAVLVACAVGATASGAVILFLVGSPSIQPSAPSISQRAIVRNITASEATKTGEDHPAVDTPSRPAATAVVSGRDESATQTEEEPVHSQESRKHNRTVTRSRESYWRRPFSPSPRFGSW